MGPCTAHAEGPRVRQLRASAEPGCSWSPLGSSTAGGWEVRGLVWWGERWFERYRGEGEAGGGRGGGSELGCGGAACHTGPPASL